MPRPSVSALIVLLWIVTTGWLIQRDLLPALGVGGLTYDRALSSRAVEETVNWVIYRGDEEVGNVFFAVHPESDGTFVLSSRASLSVTIPSLGKQDFAVTSTIYIDPLKRLDHFKLNLFAKQADADLSITGNVVDNELKAELTLAVARKEQFRKEVTFAVDRKEMMLDVFGQLDRLPDLHEGKTWRTQFVNPITTMLTGSLISSSGFDYIQHTVVDTEPIDWNGSVWPCYKVEHRYQNAVTHSWARKDGKVLIQEVIFGGVPFRLVAEPNLQERTAEPAGRENEHE